MAKSPLVPPDTHVCGSEASPICPNRPKVRLFFKESGSDHPSEHWTVSFCEKGQGCFADSFKSTTKENIEKIWTGAERRGRAFQLWGEYAFERVDRVRSPYYIDLRVKGKQVDAYRIRGRYITAPEWMKIENGEEKSNVVDSSSPKS